MNRDSRQIMAVAAGAVVVILVLAVLWISASSRADSSARDAETVAAQATQAANTLAAQATAEADAIAGLEASATAALDAAATREAQMLDAAAARREEVAAAAQATQAALEAALDTAHQEATALAGTATPAAEFYATERAMQAALHATAQAATSTAAFVEGMAVANGTDFPIMTQSAAELATAQAQATSQWEWVTTLLGPSATAVSNDLMTQQAKVDALQTEVASQFIPIYPTVVIIFETPTPLFGPGMGATPTPLAVAPSPTYVPSPTLVGPTLPPTPTMAGGDVMTPTAVAAAVALGDTYIHPRGVFQIDPPAGWEFNAWTGESPYSANWINRDERAVVHAFVVAFDEPLTLDTALAYIESEYATGLSNYDAYEVIEMKTGDPIIVDFALAFGDDNYRARQWVTIADSTLGYLRIVVPEARADLLDVLGNALLPTYRFFPDNAEVGAAATATPEGAAVGEAGIQIANVVGVGVLEEEYVELHNTDGTVNLEGWTLCGADDDCFTFPRFVLFPRGAVAVYSRTGDDTPVALFWGRADPAWEAGETISLRDADGNLQAEYTPGEETP